MEFKKALKNFIFFGSAYYTVITAVILVIASSMADEDAVKLIETDQFLKILLFSFIMSAGSMLYRISAMPKPAAICSHALCHVGGWLLFIAICGGSFSVTMISTAIFAVIYAAVTLICRRVGKISSKKVNAQREKKPDSKSDKAAQKSYTDQFR